MKFQLILIVQLLAVSVPIRSSNALHPPETLDGIWQSQGYGYVLSIKAGALTEYEITTSTCVQGFISRLEAVQSHGWDAVFQSKSEGRLFLGAAGTNERAILHLEDSVPDIRLDRIPGLPATCEHPTANTPSGNFEVFTRTFAENYISFDRRHMAWPELVAENRSKITDQTTPAQLFEIMKVMIAPLGDLHTYITAPSLKRHTDEFWRPGTNRVIQDNVDQFADHGRWKLFEITNALYLKRPPRMFCRRHLQYGRLDDKTGYLRILSFGGYSGHNDLEALESALDKIFSDADLQALVIDARLSFGGSDELGLAIARRLANRRYLAYTVQARSANGAQWSTPQEIFIQPSERPGFYGPVVELIGPITMSGAETFSEALMGRTPHVTRIGENTQGVFCDVLDRHLPNGWTFGLPNAIYRTGDGTAFDVTGIPPDIEVPVFKDSDIQARKDPAMAEAVKVLANRRK